MASSKRYRISHLCRILFLAALLGGQQVQVFGDDSSSKDESIETLKEDIASATPENTPEESGKSDKGQESCKDVSMLEEQSEALKAQLAASEARLQVLLELAESQKLEHESELGTCGGDSAVLQKEVQVLKNEVGQLGVVLERAGGEEGIKGLVEAAAAGNEAHKAKDAAHKEKEEALSHLSHADNMKAELESKLEAAKDELSELRGMLTGAESRASEAREEAGKHAKDNEEVRGKLERTASELMTARKPRKVSVSAIFADVKQLSGEVMTQTQEARDDVVRTVTRRSESAKEFVTPYVDTAVETVTPWVEKGMEATEPQRAKVGEAYSVYRGKFDDTVGKPVKQQWLKGKAQGSKVMNKGMAKWDQAENALTQKLRTAGVPEETTHKVCKYTYITFMALAAVLLIFYLGMPVLNYVVLPLVRVTLRLVWWVVMVPFRLLFLPVRLVCWVLGSCYRLAFGGGKTAGSGSTKGSGKGKSGTAGSKKRR